MRPETTRDSTFDQLKGLLVLLMVAYHVLSIASTAPAESFRYIRFISGSFIFISGYVISHFMLADFRASPRVATVRLIKRGLKIVLLFTALNLALRSSGFGNAEKLALGAAREPAQLAWVYLTADPRLASFIILLPIGYLLVAAPAILALALAQRRTRTVAAALLLIALVLGAIPAVTDISANVEFMLVGLIGLSTGLLFGGPKRARAPNALAAAVGVVVSVWLTAQLGTTVSGYAIGIALLLGSAAALVVALPQIAPVEATLTALGRYSLICYIAQIAIIQAVFKATASQRWDAAAPVTALGIATALLLVALCVALDTVRRESALADRSYRLVFS